MKGLQIYLVSYDISDDKVRTMVAGRLQYFGLERMQYSVFWGPVKRSTYKAMVRWLENVVLGEEDKIAILPLHRESLARAVGLGDAGAICALADFETTLVIL